MPLLDAGCAPSVGLSMLCPPHVEPADPAEPLWANPLTAMKRKQKKNPANNAKTNTR